jgi:hypothetical protein
MEDSWQEEYRQQKTRRRRRGSRELTAGNWKPQQRKKVAENRLETADSQCEIRGS